MSSEAAADFRADRPLKANWKARSGWREPERKKWVIGRRLSSECRIMGCHANKDTECGVFVRPS